MICFHREKKYIKNNNALNNHRKYTLKSDIFTLSQKRLQNFSCSITQLYKINFYTIVSTIFSIIIPLLLFIFWRIVVRIYCKDVTLITFQEKYIQNTITFQSKNGFFIRILNAKTKNPLYLFFCIVV